MTKSKTAAGAITSNPQKEVSVSKSQLPTILNAHKHGGRVRVRIEPSGVSVRVHTDDMVFVLGDSRGRVRKFRSLNTVADMFKTHGIKPFEFLVECLDDDTAAAAPTPAASEGGTNPASE